jgi:predicted acylesterase/phospholipase RssA
MGKIALVLSGGGSKGDFEVGVVRALYDQGKKPGIIAACSVGSINAVKLAEGDGGPSQGLPGLEAVWLGLDSAEDMYTPAKWLDAYPTVKSFVTGTGSAGDVADDAVASGLEGGGVGFAVGAALGGPIGALVGFLAGGLFGVGLDLSSLGDEISRLTKALGLNQNACGCATNTPLKNAPQSLFDLAPTEQKLRAGVSLQLVKTSGILLRIAMVRLADGALEYVDQNGQFVGVDGAGLGDAVDVISAVMASSGQPPYFPPVTLAGQVYVDGGVVEVLPAAAALLVPSAAKPDTIYAVSASPISSPVDPSGMSMIGVASQALSILEDAEANQRLEALNALVQSGPQRPSVSLFRPVVEVHGGTVVDPGLIRIAMDQGYLVGWSALQSADEDARHGFEDGLRDIFTARLAAQAAEACLTKTPLAMQVVGKGADASSPPPPDPLSTPPGASTAGSYWRLDPKAVAEYIQEVVCCVRPRKRALANALGSWLSANGIERTPYSEDLGNWVTQWERHPKLPEPTGLAGPYPLVYEGTPWDAVSWIPGVLELPAEQPPGVLSSPLYAFLTLNGAAAVVGEPVSLTVHALYPYHFPAVTAPSSISIEGTIVAQSEQAFTYTPKAAVTTILVTSGSVSTEVFLTAQVPPLVLAVTVTPGPLALPSSNRGASYSVSVQVAGAVLDTARVFLTITREPAMLLPYNAATKRYESGLVRLKAPPLPGEAPTVATIAAVAAGYAPASTIVAAP